MAPSSGDSRAPTLPVYRVMTYNVENYLLAQTGTRPPKSPLAEAKVVESILDGRPDVLALQEIGEQPALFQLQSRLKSRGLDLPYWEHVRGWDTNIFTAVLSRFPIVRRQPHTNESFLLNGRRWHLSRGIVEVGIAVTPQYRLTVFAAHLKSKRAISEASESEVREREAMVLRELVTARLRAHPEDNLALCGDLNDTRESPTLRTLLADPEFPLFDPRPAERNGDSAPAENPRFEPRRVTWTHYFGRADTYSRIDFVLMNRGLKREWRAENPPVGGGSDRGGGHEQQLVVCSYAEAARGCLWGGGLGERGWADV